MEIMSKGTFATVAALVLLLCVPLSAAGKVPTSRTDPFLKVVREKVSVEVARFEMVKKQIDWDALQKEVDKAADADERKRRQEYVDLWKVLAERHDHGCMCSKPFVFEDEVFDLLGGSLSHMTSRDRVKRLDFDASRYGLYLMTETLPPWAASVRPVAGGIEAGEGNPRGMDVLAEGFRAHVKKGESLHWWPGRIGALGARTEKALPLWRKLLSDEDPKVRDWALKAVIALGGTSWRPGESPHDLAGRKPFVNEIAFSPNGRRLVASYYVNTTNVTATDWGAWCATWDLETGKRLILPNAWGPVVFSPDGKTLATAVYERSEKDPDALSPKKTTAALWKPGETKPFRVLSRGEGEDASVDGAVFTPDGRSLVTLTRSGEFLLWDVKKEAAPVVLLERPEKKTLPLRRRFPISMAFSRNGTSLLVSMTHTELPGLLGQGATLWRFDATKKTLEPVDAFTLGLVCHDPRAVDLLEARDKGEWRWPIALKVAIGLDATAVPLTIRYGDLGQLPTSLLPEKGLLATSGPGKLTIYRKDGTVLHVLPGAGGATALSPDGKCAAAGGPRGIIRLWDVESGRLLRTLRLDDRPADTVLVAAIQCSSVFGNPDKNCRNDTNCRKLARLIREAAMEGAQIVVLPETAITGYLSPDLKKTWQVDGRPISEGLEGVDPKDAAETVIMSSPSTFRDLANGYGIYLTAPFLEVDPKTGKYYNTSVLFGPDGKVLLHYRKRDPWPWAERGWATSGDLGNPVVDTPFGRLGLLICYDIHKQAEVMGKLKIDTLLYSVAWVEDEGSDWFEKRLPAIAKDHGYHIIAANWTVPPKPEPTWHGYGQTRIIDATGKVLSKASKDLAEETVYAELPIPHPRETKAP